MIDTCSIAANAENLGAPIEQDYTHVLERRHAYRYSDRPIFWFDYQTGRIIMPDGTKGTIPPSPSLTTLLEKIEGYVTVKYPKKRSAVLYLVAERNERNRPAWEWFRVFREWKMDALFKRTVQAEYSHNGFKVSLYSTGNYFGPEKNLDLLYQAWHELENELERVFHAEGYKLLGDTPAQTGRELLLISLPKDRQYPRLPENLLDLINHNFGQGRIETFAPQREVLENGAYVLDGRWFYASCMSNLPVGTVYCDTRNEFLGVRRKDGKLAPACPGFYRVTAQVPQNWHHIGLLKSGQAPTIHDESGYYPNTPGETFTNWTTADELALALDNGWLIEIHERIYWPHVDEITDPLATLRRKLVDLRAEITSPLLKDAIRNILIHLIGSFHKHLTFENRVTPEGEMLPALYPQGSLYRYIASIRREHHWIEARPFKKVDRRRFVHPEWSAVIWGRARKHLAEFALTLPFEDIIALRIDSVWCASLPPSTTPHWVPDDSIARPGDFRKIDYIPGPWHWPVSGSAMRQEAIKRNLEKIQIEEEGE